MGSYLPDPAVTGSGTLQMDGGTIRFQGLEPIVINGFEEFTLTTPNSKDWVRILQASPTSNVIQGSSGGVIFESLEFSNVTRLALDLGANDNPLSAVDDRVDFVDDLVAAGLARVTVRTGLGSDRVDAANVTSVAIEYYGGPGSDTFDSGQSIDIFYGGPGNDLFNWTKGDERDLFDGGDGEDQARLSGSPGADTFVVGTTATAVTVSTGGLGPVQLASVEALDINLEDGKDSAVIEDLTGTTLTNVTVDLGPGSTQSVEIYGTDSDDVITLSSAGSAVLVSGLPATIGVSSLENDDDLLIDAGAGSDTLQAEGIDTTVRVERPADRVLGIAAAPVSFRQIESLAIDASATTANLWVTGATEFIHTPATATDRGTLWADGLTVQYTGLTTGEILHITGTPDSDSITLRGTDQSDDMAITGTLVTTVGRASVLMHDMEKVTFELLDGDDSLEAYPTGGLELVVNAGDPSQSDVLSVFGSAGADPIQIDLDVQVITGVGSTVWFDGVESVLVDGAGGADTLTVLGTESDDTLRYRPLSTQGGTFTLDGLATTFTFDTIPGSFTVDLGATVADRVVVLGTNNHDVITVDSPNRTVTVENAAGVVLKPVALATTVEQVSVMAGLGNDTVLVIPAPAAATSPAGQPYNLSVDVDGGPPGASDALVVAQAGGAALPASDFAIVYRGRAADEGRVRVYRNAVAMPDISYEDIEIVSPITDPGVGRDNNLLIAGPDLYEPNEYRPTAAFLGSGEQINVRNLVIFPAWGEHRFVPSDEDWFRVVAYQTGTLDVQAYFRQFDPALLPAGGDLQRV